MKKETLIAVVLGIGLGVLVAVFMVIQSRQKQIAQTKTVGSIQITPTVQVKKNSPQEVFEITSPGDNAIVSKNTVTIQGKAAKNSLIVAQSPIKNLVFKNDKETFSFEFPLALGENFILITSYPADIKTSSREKELHIFYLDEK